MERLLWVLGLVALLALVFFGMRRGWVHRARRQAAELPDFPVPPAEPGEQLLPAASGMYVGTTKATDWQDRIAVGDIGHRANGTAHLHASGLLLRRTGASALWIPAESIVDCRLDHKLANKVVPGAGLVVVTWRLGDQLLDTGFRGDDKAAQTDWVEAVRALAPADEVVSAKTGWSRFSHSR
ncbi:transporter [Saccharopolyspora sp. K220]|uniref:PH-like domain-containing protein n=1 Tax=Saccharopolyspora soli TaxID=2926618 RepID=UPI001F5681DC|nr:transporter [Saccharopolyspora soli]MCI2420201.1 transporter [Saccharopolyspora soli]